MGFYDYTVKTIEGNSVSLKEYSGKVVLVVNTATGCGFTPQYEGLQELYLKYQNQGFEILDFPCNQFLNQAPGSNEDIAAFCQLKYHTTFQTFAKINVNGKKADPLYQYLKKQTPSEPLDTEAKKFHQLIKSLKQGVSGTSIKWNFTKFLINRDGEVVGRFHPTVKPSELQSEIEKLL